MGDILVLAIAAIFVYLVYCFIAKRPIIPTKKNLDKARLKKKEARNQAREKFKNELLDEDEAVPFQDFFPEIEDIKEGMIIQEGYWYSIVAQVIPVNYYLLDEEEQDKIDKDFESWLSQLDNSLPRIYVQNRFIDLTENIEQIQKTMIEQDDLNEDAQQYGKYMLEDLKNFQIERPRFEQRYSLIFDYQVNTSELRLEDGDILEEKAMEKAKAELLRKLSTAQSQLYKSGNEVIRLSTEGIIELLYHQFNRRKARKNRFRDIAQQEMMALYSTANQSAEHIAEVKEDIDHAIQKQKDKARKCDRYSNSEEKKKIEV